MTTASRQIGDILRQIAALRRENLALRQALAAARSRKARPRISLCVKQKLLAAHDAGRSAGELAMDANINRQAMLKRLQRWRKKSVDIRDMSTPHTPGAARK